MKELDDKDGAAAVDAKGKPAAKGAAKGGGKAPEEVMKEELDAIKQVAVSGWVLLDFPKTLKGESDKYDNTEAALQVWTESFGQYAPEASECDV